MNEVEVILMLFATFIILLTNPMNWVNWVIVGVMWALELLNIVLEKINRRSLERLNISVKHLDLMTQLKTTKNKKEQARIVTALNRLEKRARVYGMELNPPEIEVVKPTKK